MDDCDRASTDRACPCTALFPARYTSVIKDFRGTVRGDAFVPAPVCLELSPPFFDPGVVTDILPPFADSTGRPRINRLAAVWFVVCAAAAASADASCGDHVRLGRGVATGRSEFSTTTELVTHSPQSKVNGSPRRSLDRGDPLPDGSTPFGPCWSGLCRRLPAGPVSGSPVDRGTLSLRETTWAALLVWDRQGQRADQTVRRGPAPEVGLEGIDRHPPQTPPPNLG